jgi:hyaluronan synthase
MTNPSTLTASATRAARTTSTLIASAIWRLSLACYMVMVCAFVITTKSAFLPAIWHDPVFGVYGMCVTIYLLSRFALSLCYRVKRGEPESWPSVCIVIPAMNEERGIVPTIEAAFALDYPAERLSVYVIDDGSTDATWERICDAAKLYPNLHALRFSHNRGKRAAMAAGIRASDAEIMCFVDSDSVLRHDALKEIVKPFSDAQVGIVCGHADILNGATNLLTRLQQVRYFVAFRVIKASESIFGSVTCASGCFSAYRRVRLLEVLPRWEVQSFLGREATFGDDRALTNMILRHHKVVYQASAVCETDVPDTLRKFMVQQIRWKKSWLRESLIAMRFIWRKNPITAVATYASNVFPLVAPIIIIRSLIVTPMHGGDPWMYVIGLYAMAVVYSLYYGVTKRSPYWWTGIAFVGLYATVLIWQTYWAIATARKTAWGTRSGRADDGKGFRIIGLVGEAMQTGIPLCADVELFVPEAVAA